MIVAPLLGLTLVVAVATGSPFDPATPAALGKSAQQKHVAMRPLLRAATECIARGVVSDPRFAGGAASNLADLIVDSMPACFTPVRAMIEAHDGYYGPGTGEAFFMGPYLDTLPGAVDAWMRNRLR